MQDLLQLLAVSFGIPLLLSLFVSGAFRKKHAWIWCAGALFALTMNITAVSVAVDFLPKIASMQDLQWNWLGKASGIVTTLVVFAFLPKSIQLEAGLFNVPRPPEWRSVIAVSVSLLAFFTLVAYLKPDDNLLTLETALFQGSMPGLDEEMSFRGVLLAMLVAAFGKPWRVLGVQIGWGALPIVAFFGLVHGLSAGTNEILLVVFVTGIMGAGLLWIKERTGSIWIAVLVHNLANLGAQIVG